MNAAVDDVEEAMKRHFAIGGMIGVIVFAISWINNRTPYVIAAFPDVFTVLSLLILLAVAIWIHFTEERPQTFVAALRGSIAIAGVTGLVFGAGLFVLAVTRFAGSAVPVAVFGFVAAFVSVVVCGAVVGAVTWVLRARPTAA